MSERQKEGMSTGFSGLWGTAYQGGMLVGGDGLNRAEAKQASQPGPHPGNIASRGQAFLELALLFSLTWLFLIDHLQVLDMSLSLISGSWHFRLLSV